jgi:hypothetical protein
VSAEVKRLPCGCENSARTMSTMVRNGRFGYGHYAQDGDFMGECVLSASEKNRRNCIPNKVRREETERKPRTLSSQLDEFLQRRMDDTTEHYTVETATKDAPFLDPIKYALTTRWGEPDTALRGEGKPELDRLADFFPALSDICTSLTHGAVGKYDFNPNGWRDVPARKHVAAAFRHAFRWLRGEQLDPDQGVSHLSIAALRLLMAREVSGD